MSKTSHRPISRPDMVQLHAAMVKNVQENKTKQLSKKRVVLKEKIGRISVEIKRLSEKSNDDLERKRMIPKIRAAQIDWRSTKSELEKVEKDLTVDHLTDYLLDAIPMMNAYASINADLRFEQDDSKRLALQRDKTMLVEQYVRRYFPAFTKKMNDINKRYIVKDVERNSRDIRKSKCCGATTVQNNDCSITCADCGLVISTHEVMISNPQRNISYNRNISPFKSYSYRRVNHLREWIRCYTGRTLINLSDEDFTRVQEEVNKQTVPMNRINADFVRRLLKRIKLNAHYEQSTAIARKLNPDLDVIRLDTAYEEKLVLQFVTIEKPFEKIRSKIDKSRKNFLSYSYVFYRLNQLNDRLDLNRDIRLLKSVKLIIRQDAFWKLICDELRWTYMGNSITLN